MPARLFDILDHYNHNTLMVIANQNAIKVTVTKKSTLTNMLSNALSNPERVRKAYAELGPVLREVVDTLQRSGGELRVATLRQRLTARKLIEVGGEAPFSGRQPDPGKPDSRRFPEIMAYLLARGLVFARTYRDEYNQLASLDFRPAREYVIPDEIRAHLPPPQPEPAWRLTFSAAPGHILESSARTFQRDLYLYWSYIHQNEVELTAKNLIVKRHLTALNNTLLGKETIQTGQVETDFLRLVFLRAVLEQMGMIVRDGTRLRSKPDQSTDFFTLNPLDRVKRTFEAYINNVHINELMWNNRVQQGGVYPTLPAPAQFADARRLILAHLKPATDWLKIEQITTWIRGMFYEFLFPRNYSDVGQYYYRPYHPYMPVTNSFGWVFPDITDDSEGWDRVEGAMIHSLISRPLFWMGLVDLGGAPDAKAHTPDLFRLTALGNWLLGGGPAPEIQQTGGQVVTQPDFTITAFDPVSDAVLYQLDQFAERITAERAVQLRMTQKSVYAGQQRDWNANRIQTYLESLTGQPLPGNVARTLQEWQTWHERIRVFPSVTILHASSVEDMQTLAEDSNLSEWLADRPAPDLAVLPAGRKPEALMSALLKRRWLPLISKKQGELPAGAIVMDTAGSLSFTVKTPDLYLRGYLARFADQEGPTTYRLTPTSVRRAANSGITAPQILADLKKVLRDPVPDTLVNNILAWAGHYGQASVEETTWINFKNEKALRELLDDAELGGLLHALKPADMHTSVRVNPKDLERVLKLLEERGVDIKSQR
jgi:hypothetical protein